MGKAILHPTKPEDLSREGLIYLINRHTWLGPHYLRLARAHELSLAAKAASEAWRAFLPEVDQARARYMELLGQAKGSSKQVRAARDAHELAEAKQERLWRASRRAADALDAYYKALEDAGEEA